MNEIVGVFDKTNGGLFLEGLGLLLNKHLDRDEFVDISKPFLLYTDKEFFAKYGFFHFAIPVMMWERAFRLSVYFLAEGTNRSSYCTGFGLRAFEYEGQHQDEPLTRQFESLLTRQIGMDPIVPPHSTARIWRTQWGVAHLGAVQQNGTEPEISIGWKNSE